MTSRRTPSAIRSGTPTAVAAVETPTIAADATAPLAEPTSLPEATNVPPTEGTTLAETTVAPADATSSPTALVSSEATPALTTPTQPRVVIVPATQEPISYNERWRQQQVNRQPLAAPQIYTTTGSELYWYDPIYQRPVLLGTFRGPFEVLATFELRSSDQPALEVLYEVNKRYGLTALSPVIVERIEAAGYTNGVIDTYVIVDDNVRLR